MSEKENEKRLQDMPDQVRSIIQRETEDGLRRFRAGNFESRLQAADWDRPNETKLPLGLVRRAWIPALGLAVIMILVISAVLWFVPSKPKLPTGGLGMIDAALKDLPGFRTMSLSDQTEPAANENFPPAAAIVSRALTFATRSATSGREPAVSPGAKLVPRYNLEQKMKILFGDKTIEQALSLFKDKFKEV